MKVRDRAIASIVLVHFFPLLNTCPICTCPRMAAGCVCRLRLRVCVGPAPVRFEEKPHQADALPGPHVSGNVGWPGVLSKTTSGIRNSFFSKVLIEDPDCRFCRCCFLHRPPSPPKPGLCRKQPVLSALQPCSWPGTSRSSASSPGRLAKKRCSASRFVATARSTEDIFKW